MPPVVCLITDRWRLPEPSAEGVLRQIRAAAAARIHLVQIRERDLEGRALLELTRRAVAEVRGSSTRILVNERTDVALAAGAHGVHLRSASVRPSRVRSIVPPGFLVGCSIHDQDDLHPRTTAGADYLLYGTVFETASKPDRPAAGLAALAAVVRATALPVLAVGGMTAGRVPAIQETGAAGYAAISMFDSMR